MVISSPIHIVTALFHSFSDSYSIIYLYQFVFVHLSLVGLLKVHIKSKLSEMQSLNTFFFLKMHVVYICLFCALACGGWLVVYSSTLLYETDHPYQNFLLLKLLSFSREYYLCHGEQA